MFYGEVPSCPFANMYRYSPMSMELSSNRYNSTQQTAYTTDIFVLHCTCHIFFICQAVSFSEIFEGNELNCF